MIGWKGVFDAAMLGVFDANGLCPPQVPSEQDLRCAENEPPHEWIDDELEQQPRSRGAFPFRLDAEALRDTVEEAFTFSVLPWQVVEY